VVPVSVQQELLVQPIQNATSSETVLGSLSVTPLGISNLFSSIWSFAQDHGETRNLGTTHLGSSLKPEKWKSGYSSPSESSKLLRAMREMDRIIEASVVIVRTPSLAAVWVIACIRWCLGVEPYIRRMPCEELVLKQFQSCVLVDIGEYGSTDFSVKTFKATGGIQELLWESKTRLIKPSAWNGMINIKTYFNTRLRKIQSSYRLLCLTSTFLSLASEIEHCFVR
jgi:hypothetical protein